MLSVKHQVHDIEEVGVTALTRVLMGSIRRSRSVRDYLKVTAAQRGLTNENGIRSTMSPPPTARPLRPAKVEILKTRSAKEGPSKEKSKLRELIATANSLRQKGNNEEAARLLLNAIQVAESLHPAVPIRVAECMENYAAVLRKLGRTEEALPFKQRASLIRGGKSSTSKNSVVANGQQSKKADAVKEDLPIGGKADPTSFLSDQDLTRLPHNQVVVQPALFEPLVALSNLNTSVIHFESFVKWDSLDQEWKRRRVHWLREVCKTTTIRDLTGLIVELEDHLLWEAVEGGWNERRSKWLDICASARTCHDLVSILLDLERYLTPEAIDEDWDEVSEQWVIAVRWNDTVEYSSEATKDIAAGRPPVETPVDLRPSKMKKCPKCGHSVREDRLERHIRKVHPKRRRGKSGPIRKPKPGRIPIYGQGSTRKPGGHRS